MSNREPMTTRDKLEKILRLADELLIEMDEDIEQSDYEPPKRKRGLGYVGEKPENQGKKWTEEDHDDLRAYKADGWSHAKIAARMKRPRKAITEQWRVVRVRDGF